MGCEILAGRDGTAPSALLALDGQTPVGFIAFIFGADPVLGTLIDNFHVLPDRIGQGIGGRLWRAGADLVRAQAPRQPVHLTAYAQNRHARAVYRRLGGREEEAPDELTADGREHRIVRFVWDDPDALLRASTGAAIGAAR